MPKKHAKKPPKWLFWVLLVVLFVAVIGVTFLAIDAIFGSKKEEPESGVVETDEEDLIQKVDEDSEDAVENVTEEEVVEMPPSKVTQYEGENPNQLGELTGSISYMGVDPTGESLMVMTNIDQYLSGGSCELIVKRNGQILATRSAQIIPDVSTSSCDRFIVPVSEIGHGDFEIMVNLSSGGKTGTLIGETKI